jgi:hypothetical protein
MNEADIAAQLRQSLPSTEPPKPAPAPEVPTAPLTAEVGVPYDVDEMTTFKLMDSLGETYRSADTNTISQTQQIFRMIAERIGSTDYLDVSSAAREYMRVIGASHQPDKLYRLYQWLKLDGARKTIEREMENLYA